jgi:hypothetical protein
MVGGEKECILLESMVMYKHYVFKYIFYLVIGLSVRFDPLLSNITELLSLPLMFQWPSPNHIELKYLIRDFKFVCKYWVDSKRMSFVC